MLTANPGNVIDNLPAWIGHDIAATATAVPETTPDVGHCRPRAGVEGHIRNTPGRGQTTRETRDTDWSNHDGRECAEEACRVVEVSVAKPRLVNHVRRKGPCVGAH